LFTNVIQYNIEHYSCQAKAVWKHALWNKKVWDSSGCEFCIETKCYRWKTTYNAGDGCCDR